MNDARRYLAEAEADVARWRDEAPWWATRRQADADWYRRQIACEEIVQSCVGLDPQVAVLSMLAESLRDQ